MKTTTTNTKISNPVNESKKSRIEEEKLWNISHWNSWQASRRMVNIYIIFENDDGDDGDGIPLVSAYNE